MPISRNYSINQSSILRTYSTISIWLIRNYSFLEAQQTHSVARYVGLSQYISDVKPKAQPARLNPPLAKWLRDTAASTLQDVQAYAHNTSGRHSTVQHE